MIEVRNIDVLRDTPIIQDSQSFVKVCSPKKLKKFHLFDFFRVKGTSLLDSLDYGSNIGSESQVGICGQLCDNVQLLHPGKAVTSEHAGYRVVT